MAREKSLTAIANEQVPFWTAACWVNLVSGSEARDRGDKAWCPDNCSTSKSMRVWDDHAWCYSCRRRWTTVTLLACYWNMTYEDAAAQALRRIGHVPLSHAELFAQYSRAPEPDRLALEQALVIWCGTRAAGWDRLRYDPAVAKMLSRCLSMLPRVHDDADGDRWLDVCKQVMGRVLPGPG
jgi:hypothetical protein